MPKNVKLDTAGWWDFAISGTVDVVWIYSEADIQWNETALQTELGDGSKAFTE